MAQLIRERIAAEGEAGGYSERMLKANTFLVVHRAARIQAEAERRPLLDIYMVRSYDREIAPDGLLENLYSARSSVNAPDSQTSNNQ